MAKRRGKKVKLGKVALVLGVAAAGVIGFILYKRSQQPGTSDMGWLAYR